MKEYVVIKEILNKRTSATDIDVSNYIGSLNKGNLLFLDDEDITGKIPVGGTSEIWKKDVNGHVVARDGVRLAHLSDNPAQYKKLKSNYNELVNIPDSIKMMKGYGVKVAVVDSGCFVKHRSLNPSILSCHNAMTGTADCTDNTLESHGTAVSGIIAGGQSLDSEIIGIAPMAELMIVKTSDVEDNVQLSDAKAALEWLSNLKDAWLPDIVNMSFSLAPGTVKENTALELVLEKLTKRGVVLIAAGESQDGIYSSKIFYPANTVWVSSVGAVDIPADVTKTLSPQLDYLLANIDYTSTCENQIYRHDLKGVSFGTAVITGIYALFISYRKKFNIKTDLMEMVNTALPEFNPFEISNNLKIYKR